MLVGLTRGFVKNSLWIRAATLLGQVVPGDVTRMRFAMTVITPKIFSLCPWGSVMNSGRVRSAAVGAGAKDLFHSLAWCAQ